MLLDVILLFILVILVMCITGKSEYLQTIIGGGKKPKYTYYIHQSIVDSNFKQEASNIIRNSELSIKFPLEEVKTHEEANIHMYLLPRAEMEAIKKQSDKEYEKYPNGSNIYFSWTYQNPTPIIYIDGDNWLYGVEQSGLTPEQYKTYVVLHEFMHALGYDHQKCNLDTAVDGVCPIMYQSTRGCPKGFKCGYSIIPSDYSKKINGSFY